MDPAKNTACEILCTLKDQTAFARRIHVPVKTSRQKDRNAFFSIGLILEYESPIMEISFARPVGRDLLDPDSAASRSHKCFEL
jgi:hypothetical protein